MYAVYLGLSQQTGVDDPLDFDRNGKVLISDMYAAYLQLSAAPLDLITTPAPPSAAVDAALADWSDPRFLGSWLYGFLEDAGESEDDEPLMARSTALDYAMHDEI